MALHLIFVNKQSFINQLNMKTKSLFFQAVILLMFSALSCSSQSVEPDETPAAAKVPLGDPFIMLWNNTYYAYGTQSPDGIVVYTSDDMLNWSISERQMVWH